MSDEIVCGVCFTYPEDIGGRGWRKGWKKWAVIGWLCPRCSEWETWFWSASDDEKRDWYRAALRGSA